MCKGNPVCDHITKKGKTPHPLAVIGVRRFLFFMKSETRNGSYGAGMAFHPVGQARTVGHQPCSASHQ